MSIWIICYITVFEPGGQHINSELLSEHQIEQQATQTEMQETNAVSQLHDDAFYDLNQGTFGIQGRSAVSELLYEGIDCMKAEVCKATTEKEDTVSDSGESSSYGSDVPLIEPSAHSHLPVDDRYYQTLVETNETEHDMRQSETLNEALYGAYINKTSEFENIPADYHCLSNETVQDESQTDAMTPTVSRKADLVVAMGENDKLDIKPVYSDYIDYVEVQELSLVTPVNVIGPCWEFGSMSSVHLPNREGSSFRSRTNTMDQQPYMGSHRDVFGGSNRLLARVFSNTIGSMEFGKKDSKEMSLTFLPSIESQNAEDFATKTWYSKMCSCNSNTKNLLVVSIGVTLMFIAMFGLTNLQSSMNSEGGLGVYSLAMSFAAFMLGSLISPWIVRRFRPKACLILGCLSPLFYVIVNFRPSFALFLPASFILGLSKVVLWNAVSTYITEIGIDESNRKNKPPDNVISRYYGIFFLTLQLAFVFGNLISSLILLPSPKEIVDIATVLHEYNVTHEVDVEYIEIVNGTEVDFFGIYTNTTSPCGSEFCNSDKKAGSQAVVDDLSKTILLGIYACCIILSSVIVIVFLDHLPEYPASSASFRDVVHQAKSVVMMLFDGRFLLLLLMCMYTIISNGFITADILTVRH